MQPFKQKSIENLFSALSQVEKRAIISHGTAFYLSSLKKQLFLARAKMRHFEDKYGISLDILNEQGLPDDADFRMHEDYVMWQHWVDKSKKIEKQVKQLDLIAVDGLYAMGELDVGD